MYLDDLIFAEPLQLETIPISKKIAYHFPQTRINVLNWCGGCLVVALPIPKKQLSIFYSQSFLSQ